MFSFDVTLLVQMCNFFLGWWLIDRYLFRFLVAEVQEEISFVDGLRNKSKKLHDDVHAANTEKELAWDTFKSVCKKHIPIIAFQPDVLSADTIQEQVQDSFIEESSVSAQEFSVQDRAKVIQHISDNLVQRIQHDVQ